MKILAGPEGGRLFGLGEQVARPVRRKTRREKVIAFIAAVTGPMADDEQYQARLAICMSNICGHLKYVKTKNYCGACGCRKWWLAELTTRLRFLDQECSCDPPFWGRERSG